MEPFQKGINNKSSMHLLEAAEETQFNPSIMCKPLFCSHLWVNIEGRNHWMIYKNIFLMHWSGKKGAVWGFTSLFRTLLLYCCHDFVHDFCLALSHFCHLTWYITHAFCICPQLLVNGSDKKPQTTLKSMWGHQCYHHTCLKNPTSVQQRCSGTNTRTEIISWLTKSV